MQKRPSLRQYLFLQMQYSAALQCYVSESMRATLEQQLIPGTQAIGSAVDAVPQLAFAVPILQVSLWASLY